MKLLTFATLLEAAPLLDQLNAKESEGLFTFDGGWILITGMGPYHTLSSLLTFPHSYDTIWNFGYAGSFGAHTMGEILPIASVEALSTTPDFYSPFLLREEGAALLSADSPLHDPSLHHDYPHTDLVDMEGYATVHAAGLLGKKVKMWKIVSDRVSSTSSKQIKERAAELSQLLAHFVIKEISS